MTSDRKRHQVIISGWKYWAYENPKIGDVLNSDLFAVKDLVIESEETLQHVINQISGPVVEDIEEESDADKNKETVYELIKSANKRLGEDLRKSELLATEWQVQAEFHEAESQKYLEELNQARADADGWKERADKLLKQKQGLLMQVHELKQQKTELQTAVKNLKQHLKEKKHTSDIHFHLHKNHVTEYTQVGDIIEMKISSSFSEKELEKIE